MDAKRKYLEAACPTKEQVDAFVSKECDEDIVKNNAGWTFDPELGFVLKDSVRHDGINKTLTYFHYEETGARRSSNFPDQVSRIHTWQEYLGGHLGERIDNYGVGGYSVYQAYRRMLKVESQCPAEYIILNIWSDDYFRSLDAIRDRIRYGRGKVSPSSWPIPHVRVDSDGKKLVEHENRCRTAGELYRITDPEKYVETYIDDAILDIVGRTRRSETDPADAPTGQGVPHSIRNRETEETLDNYIQMALFASAQIVEWTEEFCRANDKKLVLLLLLK